MVPSPSSNRPSTGVPHAWHAYRIASGRTHHLPEVDTMNRRLLAVLVSGALAAAPAALSAQSASLVVAGGLSIPVSDLSNNNNAGYNVAAGLNFGAPIIPVGARIELGYNGFDSKSGGGANTRVI